MRCRMVEMDGGKLVGGQRVDQIPEGTADSAGMNKIFSTIEITMCMNAFGNEGKAVIH